MFRVWIIFGNSISAPTIGPCGESPGLLARYNLPVRYQMNAPDSGLLPFRIDHGLTENVQGSGNDFARLLPQQRKSNARMISCRRRRSL